MSRRAVREQETQDFLEQNPQLIEYQTRIEVVQLPAIEECDGPKPIQFIEEPMFPPMYPPMYGFGNEFGAEVTPEGELPYIAFGPSLISVPGVGSAVFFVEGQTFGLFGGQVIGNESGEALVSLSGAGFGVASGDEIMGGERMYGPSGFASGFDSIDSSETLVLEVGGRLSKSAFSALEDEGPDFMTGGTSLGIDFTATGRGTVQIVLVDYDTGEQFLEELAFRGGRLGKEGHFEVDMPEGQFEVAAITTTGTLEISVVGIDLGTNFDGSSGFFDIT